MEDVQRRNGLYGFEFRDIDKRRASEGERKSYDVKQLWQRSHEIVNLAARGFKYTEIADILNITPACVSNTLNGELGQKKLSEIRLERDEEAKKVSEKIRVLTNKALQTYHEIFDNEASELTLKEKGTFASDFLKEMSGLRAPVEIHSKSLSVQLSKEDIEEFKKRGMKAAQSAGFTVEQNGGNNES